MYSNAIGCNRRTKENVKILIKTHPETWLNTRNKQRITRFFIYLFFGAVGKPFINLIDPSCARIGINIKRTFFALAQMEISAIIKSCSY